MRISSMRVNLKWVGLIALGMVVVGCSSQTTTPSINPDINPSISSSGGYYGGDSPPQGWTVDPNSITDAVPRAEPRSATGNNPYIALGKNYRPLASARGYVKRGTASWYGRKFHGRRTSSGEPYDMFAMTAAHPLLPLPTYVRVTNLDNGKSVVVKVNDRGPFLHGRVIDLSYIAAHKLDIAARGTGRVEVRAIAPESYPNGESDEAKFGSDAVWGEAGSEASDSASTPTTTILLQVGAYSEQGNANNMKQLLERNGYRVALSNDEVQVYRVRVGPFTSVKRAQVAQQKLELLLGRVVTMVSK